jgi:hypothetical protein
LLLELINLQNCHSNLFDLVKYKVSGKETFSKTFSFDGVLGGCALAVCIPEKLTTKDLGLNSGPTDFSTIV